MIKKELKLMLARKSAVVFLLAMIIMAVTLAYSNAEFYHNINKQDAYVQNAALLTGEFSNENVATLGGLESIPNFAEDLATMFGSNGQAYLQYDYLSAYRSVLQRNDFLDTLRHEVNDPSFVSDNIDKAAKQEYLLRLESKGSPRYLNAHAWEYLFNFFTDSGGGRVMIVLLLILFCHHLFPLERESNMTALLNCTAGGQRSNYFKVLAAVLLGSGMVLAFIGVVGLFQLWGNSQIQLLQQPLHYIFHYTAYDYSIGTASLVALLILMLAVCAEVLIILVISLLSRSSVISLALSFLFTLVFPFLLESGSKECLLFPYTQMNVQALLNGMSALKFFGFYWPKLLLYPLASAVIVVASMMIISFTMHKERR